MAPVRNARPGKTTVYDDSQTIDLDTIPLSGGFLIKTLALSIDPFMRGRMRDPSIKSYAPAFSVGEPLSNYAVARVLRAEHPAVKPGDHVYGFMPFQEYTIFSDPAELGPDTFRILEKREGLPWSAFLGVCGMPGQTAHHAWHEHAHAKPGETVLSLLLQALLAPAKICGLKVIASAGSDEKVAFVKSLGADIVFNYKKEDTRVYWDNVGGRTLEAALAAAHSHARFIECGMISAYNAEPYVPKNLQLIVHKEIKMSGFIVLSLHHKYLKRFYEEVPPMVASGQIKYSEDRSFGLEATGEAIVSVQKGTNTGKKVIIVAEDE
ncbi:NAD(P)-binding protein [Fomitopsis serialis]|uniref:NAD(P)-binding protein n=1 Tax=Fomitopsis serialis TaxID=139415 RepID=UPI00200795CD|nr:NAD(P)-binding protein [Neoantrodia serialis]KAH9922761.1 NAD(P)-binding protein [Neoantrodia serialis]